MPRQVNRDTGSAWQLHPGWAYLGLGAQGRINTATNRFKRGPQQGLDGEPRNIFKTARKDDGVRFVDLDHISPSRTPCALRY